MKQLIVFAIVLLFVGVGATEVIQAHQMENGDICYTWFNSLSCPPARPTFIGPPVTDNPSVTETKPPDTPTPPLVRPSSTPTVTRTLFTPTPTRTLTPTPAVTAFPESLLFNGDFELPLSAGFPQGWNFINLYQHEAPFNREGGSPLTRFSGLFSLGAKNNHRCIAFALWQSVQVEKEGLYEFLAWVRTWQSDGTFPEGQDPNAFDYMMVGIDPNGNETITSGLIFSREDSVDNGAKESIRLNLPSGRIVTVWIIVSNGVRDWFGTACEWPHTHVQIYVDGAQFFWIGP